MDQTWTNPFAERCLREDNIVQLKQVYELTHVWCSSAEVVMFGLTTQPVPHQAHQPLHGAGLMQLVHQSAEEDQRLALLIPFSVNEE